MKLAKFGAIGAIGIMALTGCSQISTAPDQAGLHYKGGALTSTSFANCVDPSTRNFDGPSDPHYTYPARQITYDFTGAKGAESAPFHVNTVDNVELEVPGLVTFDLDTDCTMLRKFHEQMGNKYQAYMNGDTTTPGWAQLLNAYVGQALQRAMTEATQHRTWVDLYNNPTAKAEWEKEVKDKLPAYVKQSMGEDYFRNFSATIQKPKIPQNLQDALEAAQVSIKQNEAQQIRNVQVDSELESIRKLVEVLGPDGYNTYQAIKDGKVQVMAIPQGSNIVLAPQK